MQCYCVDLGISLKIKKNVFINNYDDGSDELSLQHLDQDDLLHGGAQGDADRLHQLFKDEDRGASELRG